MSIQSQYHLHPFYQRSESLINLHTLNTPTLNNKNDPIKHSIRHSVCDVTAKQSKNFPYLYDQQNHQILSKHSRRHSERLSFNHKKHPLTIHTNSLNNHEKNLHYVTTKRKKLEEKSSNSLSITPHSIPTITNSESSIQSRLLLPTKST